MLRNDSQVSSDRACTRVLVRVLRPSVLLPLNSLDFTVLRQPIKFHIGTFENGMEYTAVKKQLLFFCDICRGWATLLHTLILPLLICSYRWMNLKQANPAGWEGSSGVALAGFPPIMPRGYRRVRPPSACVQQPQPHPPQPSNQPPPHLRPPDARPPQLLPPTVTGPILVPRKYLVNSRFNVHLCPLLVCLTHPFVHF